jgi:N-acetylneuraminic acid mutarotase
VWRDLGFSDDRPDALVAAAAIAIAPGFLLACYLVETGSESWRCRVVQLQEPFLLPFSESWRRLSPFPHPSGMAGILAGCHNGALIAAGGANFPEAPPWEGGKKRFYDAIYVMVQGEHEWKKAGRLPAPRAYSAVASTPNGLVVAGGEDGGQVLQDTLFLRWDGSRVRSFEGPQLPSAVTKAVAVEMGGAIYLAGGESEGPIHLSTKGFWRLDNSMTPAAWEVLESWPGPARALAVAAATNGSVFLVSGIESRLDGGEQPSNVYLRDAYRFRRGLGWIRLPDLPWSTVAAPSPAPVTASPARIFILGGVDGRQVGRLPRDSKLPDDIIFFDVQHDEWRHWPEPWPMPVVTTSAVEVDGRWVFTSGETMAAKRTTDVWEWQINGLGVQHERI